MKALTISQPYASLIASGEKWIENRTWSTRYRGPLAIHAGRGTQYLSRDELADYPTGAIVAVGRLAACVRYRRGDDVLARDAPLCGSRRTWGELVAHPYTEGPWCWVIEDVVRLARPIPCRGQVGLWTPPAGYECWPETQRLAGSLVGR